jgi:hypothetical protein
MQIFVKTLTIENVKQKVRTAANRKKGGETEGRRVVRGRRGG